MALLDAISFRYPVFGIRYSVFDYDLPMLKAGLITLAAATLLFTAQPQSFDLLITNARIVDGTGGAWYRGSVGIRGDSIVHVGWLANGQAKTTIDAGGQVLAPGFIDIHTHARRGIFEVPTAENYVRQGVTTLIEGPDGGSPVPHGPYIAHLEWLQK